ncbi:MAG TPA: CPBP family intramembrane glutamic endopeptidase [Nitrospirota bacterium]|nr:CPBP family intramembrane glutamic endopeptidase [Nitrospirota bacterium]
MKVSSRLIHPPPRSSHCGIIIIFAAALILTICSFSDRTGTWVVALSFILVASSVLLRELQAFHLAWFTAFFVTAPYMHPSLQGWPFLVLVPLLCYCALALTVPKLRSTISYLHTGRLSRDIVLLGLFVIFVSSIALCAWYRAIGPDLRVQLAHFPHMPVWMFPLAAMGFSFGNAFMEEFVYRGIIFQALDSAAGSGFLSLVIQAWLFGAVHYREGFPNGVWGLVMTTSYGIMLGELRRRSQGMLAPWVVHAAADGVIFMILAGMVLKRAG